MTTACQDFGVALKALPRVHSLRLWFSIFNYVPLMTIQPYFRYLSHPSCLHPPERLQSLRKQFSAPDNTHSDGGVGSTWSSGFARAETSTGVSDTFRLIRL
jgi:hypothetical protein